jgi:hypothetical protein
MTKPVPEHEWLQHLVGEWTITSEMVMGPGTDPVPGQGREVTKSLGGLWAFGEGETSMPDGTTFKYYTTLGYDLTFKEYRGCWFADVSSHLWKYVGELSTDGKTMTLTCEGPDMMKDNATAWYRDVVEIIDANHRTLTSYGQDEAGNWQQFMRALYTRV